MLILLEDQPGPPPKTPRDELQQLANWPYNGDPFEFDLYAVDVHRDADPYGYGTEAAKIKARALLSNQVFELFTIDITTGRHVDAPVDQVQLQPVINHDTLRALPSVPTTPIENHLADKVCALYELHGRSGQEPSTRWRDLADIVRIILDVPFDAARLIVVLQREGGRRRMQLPTKINSQGPMWQSEFPRAARSFAEYPSKYWSLDSSLEFAGGCLDSLLEGSRTRGRWDPTRLVWQD